MISLNDFTENEEHTVTMEKCVHFVYTLHLFSCWTVVLWADSCRSELSNHRRDRFH